MATVWMRAKLAKMARDRKAAPRRVQVVVPCEVPANTQNVQVTLCESGRPLPLEGKGKRTADRRTYGNGHRRGAVLTPDVYGGEVSWLIPRTP